jgi:uncharacterized protein with PIN domain
MRFLCDEMLQGLGRWLRAAGYDTAIASGGRRDRDLLLRAALESRVLLTKDRHLACVAPEARIVLLAGGSMDAEARDLRERLGVDWLHAPFTRCLLDNAALEPAEAGDTERIPRTARESGGAIRRCPRCGRVYWPGGHVRRMRERLARWQADAGAARSRPAPPLL